MSAVQELYQLYHAFKPYRLSREENILLEIELFTRICEKLEAIYDEKNKEFIHLIKITEEVEIKMFKENLIRVILNDILSTHEYTIDGIACYSGVPEEVIYEIVVGRNVSPSLAVARKIVELHRTIRTDLYRDIVQKIVNEQLETEK